MIPKCHPCHLHLQEVTQTLFPQQVDLRVAQMRRREKKSKITKNVSMPSHEQMSANSLGEKKEGHGRLSGADH